MSIAKIPETVALENDKGRNVLFKKVNEIIDALGENVEGDEGVEERVEQLETDLPLVDGRVQQLETDLPLVEGRVEQLETDLPLVEGRVEQLEEAADEMIEEAAATAFARNLSSALSASGSEITMVQNHPFSIPEHVKEYAVDGKIRFKNALAAGVSVTGITLNGNVVPVSGLDLEGKTEVYLSELIDAEIAPVRTLLEDHADLDCTWVFTLGGTVTDTITAEYVISKDGFVTEKVIATNKVAVDNS